MPKLDSLEALQECYSGAVGERSRWKEIDHINALYRKFIEASPFLILASQGPNGLDCSPRGDPPGFVRVASPRCLQIPDRKGNNRLDSIRNIIANPAVGIIFLIPGANETLRVSGQAEILVDAALCESFAIKGRPASSVMSIQIDKVYYQCQKAIARSRLWDPEARAAASELPTAGQLAQHFSAEQGVEMDAERYDADYARQLQEKLY